MGMDYDRVYELREKISVETSALVARLLDGEDPEVAQEVRQQLTEQYRFWEG